MRNGGTMSGAAKRIGWGILFVEFGPSCAEKLSKALKSDAMKDVRAKRRQKSELPGK